MWSRAQSWKARDRKSHRTVRQNIPRSYRRCFVTPRYYVVRVPNRLPVCAMGVRTQLTRTGVAGAALVCVAACGSENRVAQAGAVETRDTVPARLVAARPALAQWVLGWNSTRVANAMTGERANEYVALGRLGMR